MQYAPSASACWCFSTNLQALALGANNTASNYKDMGAGYITSFVGTCATYATGMSGYNCSTLSYWSVNSLN